MYNMAQLAEAQKTVYVISNPDGSDVEFVPLNSDTLESMFRELGARWAGRSLKGVGVAGLIRGIPTVMLKEESSDFLLVVRLTAAFAQYVVRGGQDPLRFDDFVQFASALWSLEDPRTDA